MPNWVKPTLERTEVEHTNILRWEDDGGHMMASGKAVDRWNPAIDWLNDQQMINARGREIAMFAMPKEHTNAFDVLASESRIRRTAQALEANGIRTFIAENGEQARKLFFELVPEGSQIYQGASATLDALGITADIEEPGRFDAIRPKLRSFDRKTQSDQIRHLGASPDYMVGSVNAVTEDGHVLVASASGSQLGPYVSGARIVIWIVGTQKLVKDLAEGMRRIEEYVLPLENERLQKKYGMTTSLSKLLIINKERPARITMILVNENLGL
jgi:hypothetical protein